MGMLTSSVAKSQFHCSESYQFGIPLISNTKGGVVASETDEAAGSFFERNLKCFRGIGDDGDASASHS